MAVNQEFINIHFTALPAADNQYEDCVFHNCNFEDANLSMIKFIDCSFKGCNLSLAKLGDTVFRDVQFVDCKMLGLHFEHCHVYGLTASFDRCLLNHSSFYQRKIKKTAIQNSKLVECDFTEADLSESFLQHNDFAGALFDQTNLEKADLTGSFNFSINPQKNKIKKAIFSLPALVGLLDQYDIKVSPL